MSGLMDTPIKVTCPQCGESVQTTLGDVQQGHTVSCTNGHHIKLKARNDGLQQMEQALKQLERAAGEGHVQIRINVKQ